MDIRTILKHLPKLNQWRLLTKDGPAIPVIVKALTTESNIKWNEIQPIEILRLLNRYETPPTKFRTFRMVKSIEEMNKKSKKPKSQSGAKGKSHTNTKNNSKSAQTRKRLSEPKVPDVRIRDALRTALAISQTVVSHECIFNTNSFNAFTDMHFDQLFVSGHNEIEQNEVSHIGAIPGAARRQSMRRDGSCPYASALPSQWFFRRQLAVSNSSSVLH